MSDLRDRIMKALEASKANIEKAASASDATIAAAGQKTPAVDATGTPESLQGSDGADVKQDQTPIISEGNESAITSLESTEGGVDAAIVDGNSEGEAAQALNIKEGEITEEDIDMINKAASAIKSIAARICELPAETFEKRASAEDNAVELLHKLASAGDPTAQLICDFAASVQLGMVKKANDLQEMGAEGATPEDVSAMEDALNEAALENPEAVLDMEGEAAPAGGEAELEAILQDPAFQEELQAASAQIEAAKQEEILDLAEAIKAEAPEISDEEAIMAAQVEVDDAMDAMISDQLMGATDEAGAPIVEPEAAAAAEEELAKTASAHPLRGKIGERLAGRLQIAAGAFAN